MNRDPTGERGGWNLYGFVKNRAAYAYDPYGLSSSYTGFPGGVSTIDPMEWISHFFGMFLQEAQYKAQEAVQPIVNASEQMWKAIKKHVHRFTNDMYKDLERDARDMNAVGYQAGYALVAGVGGIIGGRNAMFFPATCEVALYTYVNGVRALSAEEDMSAFNDLSFFESYEQSMESLVTLLARVIPFGKALGGSVEYVSAIPWGNGDRDAKSWLGWFYGAIASYGPVSGSYFMSSVHEKKQEGWAGGSIGAGLGLSGLAYSATYYVYTGGEEEYYWDFSEDRCICNTLRFLSLRRPEKLMRITKSFFSGD